MLDLIDVQVGVLTRHQLGSPEGIARFLGALEAAGALPTHAGKDGPTQPAFERAPFLEALRGSEFLRSVCVVKRTEPPRYEGFYGGSVGELRSVWLTLAVHDQAAYRLGDALAEGLEAEFGWVHPRFKKQRAWNILTSFKTGEFQEQGPRGITARAYLGPHLVSLFGAERLAPWGGPTISLAAAPWSASFEDLVARQAQVMEALRPAQVFCDEDDVPGAGWRPIPFPERP
jgi:hypothetical protein